MTVRTILEGKGRDVVTLTADQTIESAIRTLAEYRIGALVITSGEGRIEGIFSERDVVRVLAAKGADALAMPISSAMTSKVRTCHQGNTINDVMELMTAGRFRHLPVEDGGILIGIISIGDVVKQRISDVEQEAEAIRSYITAA
ncbi:MAG: CBS domain-containing protein [Mesorhizobium sp.]